MAFWLLLALFVGTTVLSSLLQRRPRAPQPAALGDFTVPTAEENRVIPVVFGTCKLSGPNVIWYGDLRADPLNQSAGILGFGKTTRIGYKYWLGMQLALCHGKIDNVIAVYAGTHPDDKIVPWTISYNAATGAYTIFVDQKNFFGGEQAEGGLYGPATLYDGGQAQSGDAYLASKQNRNPAPAYRGLCHIVLNWYLGTSPYIKNLSFVVQRCPDPLQLGAISTPSALQLGLAGLCGAFTDSTGNVKQAIVIGKGGTFVVPSGIGATQLQLGINDDYFADNVGTGFTVTVTVAGVGSWTGTVLPTSQPWNFSGGKNGNFNYGGLVSNGTAPIVVPLTITGGASVTITYDSGTVAWQNIIGHGNFDANGDPAHITGDTLDPVLGFYFPTHFAGLGPASVINGDANPANIIYETLTNPIWGMGRSPALIDNASFIAAGTTLASEGFGLSMLLDNDMQADQFIGEVLRHIDGVLYSDPATALYTLKLVRGGGDFLIPGTTMPWDPTLAGNSAIPFAAGGLGTAPIVVAKGLTTGRQVTLAAGGVCAAGAPPWLGYGPNGGSYANGVSANNFPGNPLMPLNYVPGSWAQPKVICHGTDNAGGGTHAQNTIVLNAVGNAPVNIGDLIVVEAHFYHYQTGQTDPGFPAYTCGDNLGTNYLLVQAFGTSAGQFNGPEYGWFLVGVATQVGIPTITFTTTAGTPGVTSPPPYGIANNLDVDFVVFDGLTVAPTSAIDSANSNYNISSSTPNVALNTSVMDFIVAAITSGFVNGIPTPGAGPGYTLVPGWSGATAGKFFMYQPNVPAGSQNVTMSNTSFTDHAMTFAVAVKATCAGNLMALLGAWTDASGNVVGSPFFIGTGGTFTTPVGATQLQVGVNDNYYPDNLGAFVLSGNDQSALPELTVLDGEQPQFSRGSWEETLNEVFIAYTDRADYKQHAVKVDESANFATRGEIVSETINFLGVSSPILAMRIAMRELKIASYPLAKLKLRVTRKAFYFRIGSKFKFTWAPYGITGQTFVVTSINYGKLDAGQIEIEAAEDIFGISSTGYTVPSASSWVDPIQPVLPPAAQLALETPYFVVPGERHILIAPVRADGSSQAYEVWADPGTGYVETNASIYGFCPSGLLVSAYKRTTAATDLTGFVIQGTTDMTQLVSTNSAGMLKGVNLCAIDNEILSIQTVTDNGDGTFTIAGVLRGVMDTLPADHAAGARVFFFNAQAPNLTYVYTTPMAADVTGLNIKCLPSNSRGTVDISAVTAVTKTTISRYTLPLPPGDAQVNGMFWPRAVLGDATFTWAHRNRLTQTSNASLVAQDDTGAGVTPEGNYTVDVLVAGTVLHTYTALTGTSQAYTFAQRLADGGDGAVQFRITPVNGALTGTVRLTDPFYFSGFGMGFGAAFGGANASN